ncbi:MAG TPA: hypothetical protein V6C86_20115 [Oculatellaceae cyanobacterium]
MASQEMLKKLLEEFDEKEAQAREEINIINVRIEELEKRIGASQDRLGKIAADRLKISQMMERYVNGSFLKAGGVAPSSLPSSSTSPIVGTPAPVSAPAAASVSTTPTAPPASPTPSISAPLSSSNTVPPGILNAPIVSASTPVSAASPANVEPTPSTTDGVPIGPVASSIAPTNIATPSNAPLSPLASVAPSVPPPSPPATPAPGPALSPMAGNEPLPAPPEFGQLPPAEATIPIGSSQPLSPMASLSSASLFSSPPAYSTDTGDNPTFQSDAANQAASNSPFTSPPSPPPIPAGGLSSALKQSMPTGGTQPTSQENRSKFDMMDLFAPLANDEEPKPAEAAEVAEPEPSPWAAPEAPPPPEPEPAPAPTPAPAFNSFFSNAMPSTTPPQAVSPGPTASLFSSPPASAPAPAPVPVPVPATEDVTAAAASTSEHPSLDLGEDTETEDGDDTVKSINDALRGLFR